ncbi:hypothetical protein [Achromobacter sp. UBA2119]|uniref:hypothetical protein n=1 Tax=Achromobacter sp. UBA2119 TaxID=1945911 RepID=UPI00257E026D|nr:hypothetical protein [Achromobacter sp. UBA2119]
MKLLICSLVAILMIQAPMVVHGIPSYLGAIRAHSQPPGILKHAHNLAEQRQIVMDGRTNGVFIELSEDGAPIIIQETTSSMTKYLSLTPAVNFDGHSLTIDCSFVRSNNGDELSVGTYCRNETEATADNIEDSINDKHMLAYSKDASWLAKTYKIGNCRDRRGLQYFGLYVVRCSESANDEVTDDITIFFLNEKFEIIEKSEGLEFSPLKSETEPESRFFWGISAETPYRIIKKNDSAVPSFLRKTADK